MALKDLAVNGYLKVKVTASGRRYLCWGRRTLRSKSERFIQAHRTTWAESVTSSLVGDGFSTRNMAPNGRVSTEQTVAIHSEHQETTLGAYTGLTNPSGAREPRLRWGDNWIWACSLNEAAGFPAIPGMNNYADPWMRHCDYGEILGSAIRPGPVSPIALLPSPFLRTGIVRTR